MPTDQTSGSQPIVLFETFVSVAYPESNLHLPWGATIIGSATNLLQHDPQAAPEISTYVNSPPFLANRPVAAAAWGLICSTQDRVPDAFDVVHKRVSLIVRRRGYYLDPALPSYSEEGGPLGRLEDTAGETADILLTLVKGYSEQWSLGELSSRAVGGYLEKLPEYVVAGLIDRLRARIRERARTIEGDRQIGEDSDLGSILELVEDFHPTRPFIELIRIKAHERDQRTGQIVDLILANTKEEDAAEILGLHPRTLRKKLSNLKTPPPKK